MIDDIRHGKKLSNTKHEVLRKFSAKVVANRGWISDQDVKEFLSSGDTHQQSMEVVLVVLWKSIAMYVNRMANPELDDAFQPEQWTKVA